MSDYGLSGWPWCSSLELCILILSVAIVFYSTAVVYRSRPKVQPLPSGSSLIPGKRRDSKQTSGPSALLRQARLVHQLTIPQLVEQLEQHRQNPQHTKVVLHHILEHLFKSADASDQFVDVGGITSIKYLLSEAAVQVLEVDSSKRWLGIALQGTWVLLQVCLGSPACKSHVLAQLPMPVLVAFMRSVMASPGLPLEVQSAVLRNCCWALCGLCDVTWPHSNGEQEHHALQHAASCGRSLLDSGLLPELTLLMRWRFGPESAAFSAGLLSSLALLEDEDPVLAATARTALLEQCATQAICHIFSLRQQERTHRLLCHFFLGLMTRHPQLIIELMVSEHSVVDFMSAAPKYLRELMICQLLSSSGQKVLACLDSQFMVDVPLALIHLIPSDSHRILASGTFNGPSTSTALHHLGQAMLSVAPSNSSLSVSGSSGHSTLSAQRVVSTLALACRLLLVRSRLHELVSAFFEDVSEALRWRHHVGHVEADGAAEDICSSGSSHISRLPSFSGMQGATVGYAVPMQPCLTDVVTSVVSLVNYLVGMDLQLSKYRMAKGSVVEDTDSSGTGPFGALESPGVTRCLDTWRAESIPEALESADLLAEHMFNALESRSDEMLERHAQERLLGIEETSVSLSDCQSSHAHRSPDLSGPAFDTSEHGYSSDSWQESSTKEKEADIQAVHLPQGAAGAYSCQDVTFKFGDIAVGLSMQAYHKARHLSSLVHSWLCRADLSQPVTLLSVPGLSDQQNAAVFRQLVAWATASTVTLAEHGEALLLWKAADYLQIDDLQVFCEDTLAGFMSAPGTMAAVLEVVANNGLSAGRLQHLCVTHLMVHLAHYVQHQQLLSLLVQYRGLLTPCIVSEMRDRLVALVMLTDELAADQ